MNLIIMLLSVIMIIIIITLESIRIRKKKVKFDVMLMTSTIFVLCYAVVPLYSVTIGFEEKLVWMKFDFYNNNYVKASTIAIITYIFMYIGYQLSGKVSIKKRANRKKSIQEKKNYILVELKRFKLLLIIISLLSLSMFVIYFYSIGGIYNAIKYAELYRAGQGPVKSNIAFIKYFLALVLYTTVGIYIYSKEYKQLYKRRNIIANFFFVMFFVLSIIYCLHDAGRYTIASFILSFYIYKWLYNERIPFKQIVGVGMAGVLIIIYGNVIFSGFLIGFDKVNYLINANMVISKFLKEFSFPYYNVVTALSSLGTVIQPRYFVDFLVGWLYLVPERLFNSIDTPTTLSTLNTIQYGREGHGTIPVDLISYGYYNLGIAGILLLALIYGCIGRIIDNLVISNLRVFNSFLFSITITYFSFRIMYADTEMLLLHGIAIVLILIINLIIRTSIKNNKV